MKAISTKYLGATNTKPARIKAYTVDNNSLTLSRHLFDELDGEELHKIVACRLCAKMGWSTDLLGGGTKEGWVFVFKNQK